MSAARLQICTLSGRCLAEMPIRRHGSIWLPQDYIDRYRIVLDVFDVHNKLIQQLMPLRQHAFQAIYDVDIDFPIGVQWFLDATTVTPIVETEGYACCNVVFPSLEFECGMKMSTYEDWRSDDEYYYPPPPPPDMFKVDDAYSSYLERPHPERQIIIGRWSDPGSLHVALYLANSVQQKECIALNLSQLSVCMLEYNQRALNHVLTMLRSPKLSIVNRFDEEYKGNVYDTSLIHMLLRKPKWDYSALVSMLGALMSRSDIDFSCEGWSSTMRRMVSGHALCFNEWQMITGKSRLRRMWTDPKQVRLHLLAISTHIPYSQGGIRTKTDVIVARLLTLVEGERRFQKHGDLRRCLLEDMGHLALSDRPWCSSGAATPEDIGKARDVLTKLL